jgi:hypothetical protein
MRGWGADLPTRRGKSIGGDCDVDDEGSELRILAVTTPLLRCYLSMKPELTSPRRLIPASSIKKTSKNEVEAI